jgi:hypothetical protein
MSARPLSVVITGESGTDSELAAQSSINSVPANPIVEKAPLFTGFKTTSLNGRDERAWLQRCHSAASVTRGESARQAIFFASQFVGWAMISAPEKCSFTERPDPNSLGSQICIHWLS